MSDAGGPNDPQEPAEGHPAVPPPPPLQAPPSGGPGYPPQGPPPGYLAAGSPWGAPPPSPTAIVSIPTYPITAGFDAPLKVARWRVIGNPVMAIPHLFWLYILGFVAGILAFIGWFAALFTGRLPDGLGNFIAGYMRYQYRVYTFYYFLREPYPTFQLPEGYAEPGGDATSWVNMAPPSRLSRLAVFFRGILIIPQYFFGLVLGIAASAILLVAWFAVLFTGRWPAGMRSFVVRFLFWQLRVQSWYLLLADPYPPFTVG